VVLGAALFFGSLAAAQQQNPSGLPGETGPSVPPPPLGTQTPATAPAPGGPGSNPTASPQSPLGGIGGFGTGSFQSLELREFSNLTRVTGDARDRSFLTRGNNNDLDFSFLQDFIRGVTHFEVLSVGRYTDDPRVDPEHTSLQRAYFRAATPHYELNVGDYLVSYSRFTYNQNLKGLHYIRRWGDGFRLLANAGTFTDRYGSLFKDNLLGKPYTRVVSGVRAEERFGRDQLLAGNWSYGNDIVRSIPVDPATGTQTFVPVRNNVVSLDTRMSFFNLWQLQAELAYSDTITDTRFSHDYQRDYALRADNSVRKGSWSFNEYFTRIMPSFYAVNARQVADLQDFNLRVSDEVTRRVSAQVSYRRTNDDLRENNTLPRTVFQLPEARVSFRELPGLGNTLLDVGYRERHQEQPGLASRITRAPYFEVGIPISSSVLTFGFEHRANIDRLARQQQTSANDASVSFRSVFNLANWMFTPLLRYELNREIFDRVSTANNNRNIQAGIIVEAPRYFIFEELYREVGATLFQDQPLLDPRTLLPVLAPNGLPSFAVTGPSGFRRPAFHFAITYKISNDENHTVTISYDRNNNLFALPGQNFLERVLQVTVVWRIRKQ
jgi:hypothetical protein